METPKTATLNTLRDENARVKGVDGSFDPGVLIPGVLVAEKLKSVKNRSKLIALLRFILPAFIVLLIGVNMSWITIQSFMNSLSTPKARTDEIRMTNPRFQGQTDARERYIISGLEAVRPSLTATKIALKSPAIDLKGKSEHPVHLQADNGVFDESKNIFYLKGNVIIKGGTSDFSFVTEAAELDLNKSEIYGDKHVEAKGSMGHIVGEAFRISDNGNRIFISGRAETKVKTYLMP
jgi:LPS export ABC transporter protein LptC